MSMSNRDGVIWFNGKLVPWREASTHVLTHTLHYGMGVFEGVRAYETEKGAAIFRLKEHTRRLFDSAHIMNMKVPFSQDEISAAHVDVIKGNKLPHAYLRPMVFFGSEAMGLRAKGLSVNVIVAAWEWPAYMSAEAMEQGIKVRTSSFARHHVNVSMTRAKANGNYISSMLALNEALSGGAEEALMLDTEGFVSEGSAENVFVVRDGIIYTPEVTSCLDGITRKSVMQLASELGYTVKEKRITRDEVYIADEVFFTGTAAEVTPVRELDTRQIGIGKRGPITTVLQAKYAEVVRGKSAKHVDWLTYCK